MFQKFVIVIGCILVFSSLAIASRSGEIYLTEWKDGRYNLSYAIDYDGNDFPSLNFIDLKNFFNDEVKKRFGSRLLPDIRMYLLLNDAGKAKDICGKIFGGVEATKVDDLNSTFNCKLPQ